MIVAFSANISLRSSSISGLSLANIEALSQNEGSGETLNCWQTISTRGSNIITNITYCGECKPKNACGWYDPSTCTTN
jgi:hypothetical protein